MSKVLIIGAGGVGNVVAHKCAWAKDVFSEILLASRTKSKCDKIAEEVLKNTGVKISTAGVDADNVAETVKLINAFQPKMVINVALPYQDLAI
ncbi:MAG: saccharopine dehydrogenase NADP-binding domain-containing protein, partial [Cytophagales bacterium]|nr:saccharopine dehydrogenase NADP-binding domain-containing protein [Cytophagales bacterium]